MGENTLQSQITVVDHITASEHLAMFEIFARHYDCVSLDQFLSDLAEKECALVLRNREGAICGFSTQQLLRMTVQGRPLRAVFSGDTVVDRAYWGEQALGQCWCRYVSALYAQEPDVPLYWFLISKGYRTYLYLPLFFERFYPSCDLPTPPFEQAVLDALAAAKFPHAYRPERGVIEFEHSKGQLKPHLAGIPQRRLRSRQVQFFLQRNPGYRIGHELACLAEISPSNLKLFAGRIMMQTQVTQTLFAGAD